MGISRTTLHFGSYHVQLSLFSAYDYTSFASSYSFGERDNIKLNLGESWEEYLMAHFSHRYSF